MSPTLRRASGRSTRISTSSLSSRSAMRVSLALALMMISLRINLPSGVRRGRFRRIDGDRPPECRILECLEGSTEDATALHPHRVAMHEEEAGVEIERGQEAPHQEIRTELAGSLEPRGQADTQGAGLRVQRDVHDGGTRIDRLALLTVTLLGDRPV